jgi:hypothetical protein
MRSPDQKGKKPGPGSFQLPIPRGKRYDSKQIKPAKAKPTKLLIRSLRSMISSLDSNRSYRVLQEGWKFIQIGMSEFLYHPLNSLILPLKFLEDFWGLEKIGNEFHTAAKPPREGTPL